MPSFQFQTEEDIVRMHQILMRDCQRILTFVNDKDYHFSPLSLNIEFSYYHYRNQQDSFDLENRFNKAFHFLTQRNVLFLQQNFIQLNKEAYLQFFRKEIQNKL